MNKFCHVVALTAVLALNTFAVTGVAVSVHSSGTNPFGHAVGNIERFIITDDVPDAGTVIYGGGNGRCVSISPNGSRIAFIRSDGKVCMQSIDGGGQVTVLASIPANSWIDWPVETHVYYVNKWQGDEMWRVNTSGTPVPEKVATGLNSCMQFSIAPSLDKGTAVTCCYSARSWSLSGSTISLVTDNGGCGAGISPDGTMFTNNQGDHASVVIRNFDGSQKYFFRTNSAAGGTNWNRNRWSANSNEWVTFTQGTPYQQDNGHHQVLYKIDGSQSINVQPYRAGVYYEGDDFWVGSLGPVPAELHLDKSSLDFSANIGAANPAAQTVNVTNGGDGTLPAVTVSDDADWLSVSVSGGGNAQTLTNTASIAGLDGNVYNATVTVSASGLSSVQYTVQLTVVAPAVLASIEVTPATAYVAPGATQQFSAAGKDQYGAAFAVSGTQWSVSGGGSISTSGLFTAGATEGGPFVVTATAGGKSGTAAANVASAPPVHLKINSGGPAVSGWEAGAAYVSGGEAYDFLKVPPTAGVTDPAPADVYQTVHHSDHTYSFTDVPDGTYTVRLHFVDQAGDGRAMDYTIEGVKVIDNMSISAEAGGINKVLVKEFEVSVADGNGLQIVASKDAGNDVFEAGIEVIGGSSSGTIEVPPVTILSPNGGEVYKVGEEITVEWEWDTTIHGGAAVWFSADSGDTYKILSSSGSIPAYTPGTNRGTFSWTIPESMLGESTVSDQCMIKVWEYTLNDLVDETDAVFSIVPANVVTVDAASLHSGVRPLIEGLGRTGFVVHAPWQGGHELSVVRLDGTVVQRSRSNDAKSYLFGPGRLTSGVYLVKLQGGGKTIEQRVTVVKE